MPHLPPHLLFFAFGPERFGPNSHCSNFQTFVWQCGPNLQRIRIAIWPPILAGSTNIVACRCKPLQTPNRPKPAWNSNMYLCKSNARINPILDCTILASLFWDILKYKRQTIRKTRTATWSRNATHQIRNKKLNVVLTHHFFCVQLLHLGHYQNNAPDSRHYNLFQGRNRTSSSPFHFLAWEGWLQNLWTGCAVSHKIPTLGPCGKDRK